MNYFYLRVNRADKVKLVISVSKKVSKKSVVRNKIKRRVRAITRDIIPELKPALYLLIAKPGAENIKGKDLKIELAELLKKG